MRQGGGTGRGQGQALCIGLLLAQDCFLFTYAFASCWRQNFFRLGVYSPSRPPAPPACPITCPARLEARGLPASVANDFFQVLAHVVDHFGPSLVLSGVLYSSAPEALSMYGQMAQVRLQRLRASLCARGG